MNPYLQDADFTLYNGDALDVLREMPSERVDCCITSPPYWGLRDYGAPGQLGLEPTPEEYVACMVEVFREVRRVLAKHGTCWLNMGDSYAGGGGFSPDAPSNLAGSKQTTQGGSKPGGVPVVSGLKPKDLCGIPWRVAFALQADGWYLRSDIVWSKPNPMPESVTDRPTKAHEMIFLLSKAPWTGPEPGQFGDISNEDARWLALLFDTEGNIVIKRAERDDRLQYGAQIAFANTNRTLLERAQAIVGAGSINERAGKNAPMFYWQLSGRQARDLLYRIYPFLIVKPRQARVAIHMQDVIAEPKKRPGGYRSTEHAAFLERCWLTVKDLNHFGTPDLSWVPEPRYGKWGATRYFFDQEAVREAFDSRPQQRLTKNVDMPLGPARVAAGVQQGNPQGGAHVSRFVVPGGLSLVSCPECAGSGCGDSWQSDECGCACHAEPARGPDGRRKTTVQGADGSIQHRDGERWPNSGRNIRTVWEITTQPYPEAHFATFPEELVRRCLLAGCPEGGTVLDPFMGSGTTALVARKHGRHTVGIELSEEYCKLASKRLAQQSLFA